MKYSSPYKESGNKPGRQRVRGMVTIKLPSIKDCLRPYHLDVIQSMRGKICSKKCSLHPCENIVYFRCRGKRKNNN